MEAGLDTSSTTAMHPISYLGIGAATTLLRGRLGRNGFLAGICFVRAADLGSAKSQTRE